MRRAARRDAGARTADRGPDGNIVIEHTVCSKDGNPKCPSEGHCPWGRFHTCTEGYSTVQCNSVCTLATLLLLPARSVTVYLCLVLYHNWMDLETTGTYMWCGGAAVKMTRNVNPSKPRFATDDSRGCTPRGLSPVIRSAGSDDYVRVIVCLGPCHSLYMGHPGRLRTVEVCGVDQAVQSWSSLITASEAPLRHRHPLQTAVPSTVGRGPPCTHIS